MKTVAIIDYGMGNLDSVARAVEECGGTPLVTDQREEIERASSLILPGVGAFADGIRQLRERGLDSVLREQALERGIPLLGICLGMQLLATKGFEGGEMPGLNLIEGEVHRLTPDSPETRIPHVGWNEVEWLRVAHPPQHVVYESNHAPSKHLSHTSHLAHNSHSSHDPHPSLRGVRDDASPHRQRPSSPGISSEYYPLSENIPFGKDFYFVHSYHFVCARPENAVARTPYCGSFTSCIRRDNVFGVQFHPEKSQRVGLALLRNFVLM